MRFLEPQYLWLLWVLPPVFLLALHAHARVRTAARTFTGEIMAERLLPRLALGRALWRAGLLCAGLGLTVLALAAPSWGSFEEETYAKGVDLAVVLDVSRSMLTENDPSTPLERAKSAIDHLVRDIPGDRVGLVLFAGSAVRGCVLTSDHGFFRDSLLHARPEDAGRGGTHIGPALMAALRLLEPRWYATHRVILDAITDPKVVEAYRKPLTEMLGVGPQADLEKELARLLDPEWIDAHEAQLAKLFGEDWRRAGLEMEDLLEDDEEASDPAAELRRGGKVALLITDGYDQNSQPLLAARILAQRGVKIVVAGVGDPTSPEGRPLILDGQPQRTRKGDPILIRLDEKLLREIAVIGKGMYVPPGNLLQLAAHYRKHIDPLEKSRTRRAKVKYPYNRFQLFLLPAIALLIWYAATSPYRRRSDGGGSGRAPRRAAAALALAATALGGAGCTGESEPEQVRSAIAALAAGRAERAEKILSALQEEHREDPRVAYDRGCALQALERRREAEREYLKALTGGRRLRALAVFNLATLEIDALRALFAERRSAEKSWEPLDATAKDRTRIEELARSALDDLERAEPLDPSLKVAARTREQLSAWLAAVRDRWWSKDRAERRAKLRALEGAEYVAELEKRELALDLRLAGASPLDLALEQDDLLAEIPILGKKIAAAKELDDKLRAELIKRASSLREPMERCSRGYRALELADAGAGQREAAATLQGIWSAWAPPAEVLARLGADQAALHTALVDLLAPKRKATREETQAAGAEQRRLIDRLGALRERLVRAGTSAWPQVVVAAQRELAPRVLAAMQTAAEGLEALPGGEVTDILAGAAGAQRYLEWMAEAIELAKLKAPELAERAARRADELTGSLRAAAGKPDPEQAAEPAHLRMMLPFLLAAIDALAGSSKGEVGAQVEKALEGLRAEVRAATEALVGEKVGAQQAREAAVHLWEVWSRLSSFEAILERGVDLASDALAQGDALREQQKGKKTTPGDALAREEVLAGQGAVGAMIARLRARLPGEIARLEKAAASKPGKSARTDSDESAQILAVLRGAEPMLARAQKASLRSIENLRRDRFEEAREGQAEAHKELEELRDKLSEARKSLPELLGEYMRTYRALAAGLEELRHLDKDEERAAAWKRLGEEHSPLEGRLPTVRAAFQRERARLERGAAEPAGKNLPAPDPKQVKTLIEGLEQAVEDLAAAVGKSAAALKKEDLAAAAASVDEAHDRARRPWSTLEPLEPLVNAAIEEEKDCIERSGQQALAEAPPPAGGAPKGDGDERARRRSWLAHRQSWTRELVAPMITRAQIEQRAGAAAGLPAGAAKPPAQGQAQESPAEIALRNLPLARDAMRSAEGSIKSGEWDKATASEREALRLLEEIFRQRNQNKKGDQNKRQDEPNKQRKRDKNKPEPQRSKLSPQEIERLLRAARERKPRERPPVRSRTNVEEDH